MNNIQNIYSLSPLQQGLLFHTVSEPASRVYQQQLSLCIEGALDTTAFASAWQQIMMRHAVLRTAILWEDLDDAYQVVFTELPVPLVQLDWRDRSDQEQALQELEIAQREEPLELSAPPLMRLCLVRLGEQRWQMIWTHHHIVLDGWSEGIVLSDWLACYKALSASEPPTFAPTRPFQDYIGWLGEQDESAAAAYWRGHLGRISEPTPLPAFSPATALKAGELPCAEQTLTLSPTESQRMIDSARVQRVTLNTLVQAAWALLLGGYAGREEVLFGITLGGRPEELTHSDTMVGLFINTLPLNIVWDQEQPVGDWLRSIQDDVAELRQYEHSALSRLKTYSGMPADQALFEAILVFENFPLDASLTEAAPGLRFSASESGILSGDVRLTQGRNNFPLSLIAVPSGDAFEFILSYARSRFSDGQIRLMLGHLRTLLNALTAAANQPSSPQNSAAALHWLPENEWLQLKAWGEGIAVPTEPLCLHQLFERHAEHHPLQQALVTPTVSLSYAELDAQANQLARHLLSLGLEPGNVAAIALERSSDFVIALLAVLKTGATYLPLDVKQPPMRLGEILDDSDAKLVLTEARLRAKVKPCGALRVVLDELQESLAQLSSEPVVAAPGTAETVPASAAYLIYTSGSTGAPKGVLIDHHAIVNYLSGALDALQLPIAARYGLVSTLAADLGHTQLFGALAGGGTLVLAGEETVFNPQALAQFFADAHIDVLKLTPSHLQGLLAAHDNTGLLPEHTLILGGEPLDAQLVTQIRALKPALRIVNHYGPTETAVGATYYIVPENLDPGVPVPLGRPLPNRRLYILDKKGQPSPMGVPGELYIGGSAIAREYWRRPELTAERFLADPFTDNDQRMYRTGDRVRWLDNGALQFLGRVDNQVKIRGFRIELGEVEAQIKALSAEIRQVLARLLNLPDQAPRLVAYVVADSALSTDKLREDLSLRVPEYSVPSAFVLLDAIPLNANGKPDYKALPTPGNANASEREYTPPRTETERQLAEIWQAVLKIESVGIHDNFFSLGGDSILNLQIIARAGQAGLKLTPKQLFEHRTVAQLAAVLHPDDSIACEDAAQEAISVPLTAGQKARLDAGPLTASWRLVTLDRESTQESITQALCALQRYHRVLQMGLSTHTDGHWQQTLATPYKPISVSQATLSGWEQPALAGLANEILAGLDLHRAETLHACLLNEGERLALLLVAHPLIMDEASWSLLLRDFGLALHQIQRQRPLVLPWTGGDWENWSEHQQAYAKEELDASWEHWLQYAGLPRTELEVPDTTAKSGFIELEQDNAKQLARLRQRTQVSWEAVLTVALAHVVGKELSDATLLFDVQSGRPSLNRLSVDAPIAGADFDPSRMVGALAHDAPLFLNWDRSVSLVSCLFSTEAQLAQQPQRGADYAVLRYLSDNPYLQEPLSELPAPQFGLSWLGDWDSDLNDNGFSGKAPLQAVGAASHPPPHNKALQISAYWYRSTLCLNLQGPLAEEWKERLQLALIELAAVADSQIDAPGVQAFPLCTTHSQYLGALPFDWSNIEDVYPLSTMQQGMLLHSQLNPESGVYWVQERFRWQGPLNRLALEQSWRHVLARHPILRTGFTWQHSDVPLQYVCREVDSHVEWQDWRTLSADVQETQLDRLLNVERRQGFDLRQPPLIRLRVFQVGEQDYLLVRSFHHLLSDAWSFSLVMQDLLALYQAECQQVPAALPVGRPFGDYIRWLMRQDLNAAEGFWRSELQGFDEPTPLPKALNGATAKTSKVAEAQLNLSVAQTQKLQQRCQHYQLTANTWLQGAWALLLSRYSGKRDVLFGMTVAGRPSELAQVENITGVFINSLPLRVAIDDQQSVCAWLAQLFERSIRVRDYEHTPLVHIQGWSDVGAGRPLFESLLIFENAPMAAADAMSELGFSIDLVEDSSPTNYPINLMVMPGSRLGLRITYDNALFKRDTIKRMLDHLGQLLESMLEQPEAPLGALQLLTPTEYQQIVIDWNDSSEAFPLQSTYAQLFAQQTARYPQRVVAVCGDQSLTYAELDTRANRIAHTLIAAGAKTDSLVALHAERGLPLLTMMLAVFKAGAAYQPLDINHPTQRLAELLELSGAPIILASEQSAAQLDQVLAQSYAKPTCLIAEELWTNGPTYDPAVPGTPDDLAYVIFTSGSTGTPKGAMVEQRGMLNNIYGKIPAIGLAEGDRLAQTASPAFDISVWQFLAAPLLGATVHILPDEITQQPARLLQAVDQQHITLMEVVPSVMRAMLADCPATCSLASLRWLMSIGEALPPALCRDWFARFAKVPLLNLYGPAECADNIGYHPITEPPGDECQHMPIGRPTANNQLYVLDDALRPLPVGIPGEICTSGFGVGRGYLNDAERTQAAFVPHPLKPGARFYCTGDIGRYLPNGVVEYLGRRDQQVKIRGQRIELGEIENRLTAHPELHAAAVLALPDKRGETRLVAYVQSATGTRVNLDKLRAHLASALPAYAIPAAFVPLETLPLNANGKLDRKALAALQPDFAALATGEYVAPRNATETAVAEICSAVLGQSQVSMEDNFFSIGGHSLLATQVLSRIRQNLGVELPLKTIFASNTIADLASAVATQQASRSDSVTDASAWVIAKAPRTGSLPLSYAQQRLWFVDQLEGASGTYNIAVAVKLTGALNPAAVQAAVDTVIARHESLRTCFRVEGDGPRQIILDQCDVAIASQDLSQLAVDQQPHTVQRLIDEEAERPFDLSEGPMLRVALLRLEEQSHILQFTLHHIAADAWSMAVLIREFVNGYEAYAAGTQPALPPLPIQYGDYAYWQRSEPQQRQLAQDIDFWRRELSGVPPVISLPLDKERPQQADYTGAAVTQTLSAAQSQALKNVGQAHGATLFMVLLNAFNCLLQRATGKDDFIVGTDLANREHHALEGLIGFFVNVLPLRAQLDQSDNFTQRLQLLRESTLAAFERQQTPFDKLVEVLQPPRLPGVNPLVQVLFVMQNAPKAEGNLNGLQVEELAPQHETSKFDLAVFAEEDEAQQITVRWLYRTSLFEPQTIDHLREGFQSLLDLVALDARHALEQWEWQIRPAASEKPMETAAMQSEHKASRKQAKLSKLKRAKPTMVSDAPEEQVKTSTLTAGASRDALPLIIEPKWSELDPMLWAQQSRSWIEARLRDHGGLLFRGFNLPGAADFERFAQAIEPSLYGKYGDLPKNSAGNNIYHSTPYPEKQMILYHNESSHLAQWPQRQWFYCEVPAQQGGCTPIVDCREMVRRLPASILAPMERKGLLYVRHFTDKLDVKWQDFFKTEDRQQVEEQCRQADMRWEWFGTDSLRIEQHCDAVVEHPETGEKSFFNQVQLHHESCLEPEVRRNLHSLFGKDRLPRNVYYGDGSPIADATMEEIGRLYEACAVRFAWQKRDVIMLDNMLVAHARDPFAGERKICVAMGKMLARSELPASQTKTEEPPFELQDSHLHLQR